MFEFSLNPNDGKRRKPFDYAVRRMTQFSQHSFYPGPPLTIAEKIMFITLFDQCNRLKHLFCDLNVDSQQVKEKFSGFFIHFFVTVKLPYCTILQAPQIPTT